MSFNFFLFFPLIFLCVWFVCVYTFVWEHVCSCMWWPEADIVSHSWTLSTFTHSGRVSIKPRAPHRAGLTSQLALGIPRLCFERLELQGGLYKYLAFTCVSGDLNSDPHIYVASTLVAEPSLLSLDFSVMLGLQACITMTSFM